VLKKNHVLDCKINDILSWRCVRGVYLEIKGWKPRDIANHWSWSRNAKRHYSPLRAEVELETARFGHKRHLITNQNAANRCRKGPEKNSPWLSKANPERCARFWPIYFLVVVEHVKHARRRRGEWDWLGFSASQQFLFEEQGAQRRNAKLKVGRTRLLLQAWNNFLNILIRFYKLVIVFTVTHNDVCNAIRTCGQTIVSLCRLYIFFLRFLT
jgi:hypothetical protein